MFQQEPDRVAATSLAATGPGPGSRDGDGAGDHDQPYMPRQPRALSPFPFTTRQYARLLLLRSRVRNHPRDEPMLRLAHVDDILQRALEPRSETPPPPAVDHLPIEQQHFRGWRRLAEVLAKWVSPNWTDAFSDDVYWLNLRNDPYA
jgi:hypothetical protein